jgi:hypothetical protein
LQDHLADGVSFYVMLSEIGRDSLVQFGVADVKKYGGNESPFASFAVHDVPAQNVLALGMAIALAQIVGGDIEDEAGHWFTGEPNTPAEALAKFRIDSAPADLHGAINSIDAKLKRGGASQHL